MRKASRVKYPANPKVRQPIPRAKVPRDWLDILQGMLSEFNIKGNSVNIVSLSVLTGTYYMYSQCPNKREGPMVLSGLPNL